MDKATVIYAGILILLAIGAYILGKYRGETHALMNKIPYLDKMTVDDLALDLMIDAIRAFTWDRMLTIKDSVLRGGKPAEIAQRELRTLAPEAKAKFLSMAKEEGFADVANKSDEWISAKLEKALDILKQEKGLTKLSDAVK